MSHFVMNADLLTDVNFSNLLDFHCFGNANATNVLENMSIKYLMELLK